MIINSWNPSFSLKKERKGYATQPNVGSSLSTKSMLTNQKYFDRDETGSHP